MPIEKVIEAAFEKEIKNPEDEIEPLNEADIRDQIGHMTISLLNANKKEIVLRKTIKELREKLNAK